MTYNYRRTLTIDHTKVGSGTQASFPVLVSGIYAYLATQANGGGVTNANGYDIIFTSDALGTTQLFHEIESYNATTGEIAFWVNAGTGTSQVNGTTDSVIYMWYGNSAISTFQSTATSVWDSNYKGVWHLPNGSTLTALDSTTNANNGTLTNTPTAVAGKVDGAAHFTRTSDQYINAGNGSSLQITGNLTMEAWGKFDSTTANGTSYQLLTKDKDTGGRAYTLEVLFGANHNFRFYINGGAGGVIVTSTVSAVSGTFYHVVATWNDTSKDLHIVVNGTDTVNNVGTGTIPSATANVLIGRREYTGFTQPWDGTIDECRISNVVRASAWITTSYNNQNSPSTFYSVSAQSDNRGQMFQRNQAVNRSSTY